MKKNKIIPIRVTSLEKEKLENNAEECGLNVSKFIRKQCIESSPVFISKEDRNEIKDLKNIGLEIKRTLNLYHEKRKEHSPFLKQLRGVVSKFKNKL